MLVKCDHCKVESTFSIKDWRCPCGGAWEPATQKAFDPTKIKFNDYSIWRYGDLMGLDIMKPFKNMGVGWTPLVPMTIFGHKAYLKLDFLSPSGSFKDRGVNGMINQLVHMGVRAVVEDSSGNAGASVAAHAARLGIHAKIFIPAYASPAKQHQIAVYGAEINKISGPRLNAEKAAQAAVNENTAYASHAYNPVYLASQATAAWELWEQLGRVTPDWIIMPVAQGGLFLGYWSGFKCLMESGLTDHLPRLVAVQSEKIAPIYQAWSKQLPNIPGVEPGGATVAEGVSIAKPLRGKRLLQALRETKGRALAINDDAILSAQQHIAKKGFFIEPTSALTLAGFQCISDEIEPGQTVVLPLTGSGLKGAPQIKQ